VKGVVLLAVLIVFVAVLRHIAKTPIRQAGDHAAPRGGVAPEPAAAQETIRRVEELRDFWYEQGAHVAANEIARALRGDS